MLKRVGIVSATAVAGLLALSPIAFAGENGHGDDGDGDSDRSTVNAQSGGLLNLQNVGVKVPVQACNNSLLGGVLGILSSGVSNQDSHDGSCSQDNGDD